jgi:hypothetical protein
MVLFKLRIKMAKILPTLGAVWIYIWPRVRNHAHDLAVALSTASDDPQRHRVVALRLDNATDGKTAL